MKLKLLLALTILTFLSQIVFSIYYSIKIVDENSLINQYQALFQRLNIQHQTLEMELAMLNSLSNFTKIIQTKPSYIPITNILDLNK